MPINNKVTRRRQQHIQNYARNNDAYSFFNILTSPELLETVDGLVPEHRDRVFPPTETLSMFLAQALSEDRSCQKAVNDAAVKRVVSGLPAISTATGGYCRARQRLPLEMVSTLVTKTGELMDSQIPEQWRWHGRRVHLIDGTTISMPDTKENQERYPQQGGQKTGLGFPICRLLGVICLSSGAVLNASIGRFKGKGADEQTLLRNVLGTFNAGDLVLGDAFFGTYFLLAALLEKGVDAVFEQLGVRNRITDFKEGEQLGSKDHLTELTKPKKKPDWMEQHDYDNAPNSLRIRELAVDGKTLITTLLSPKAAPKAELKALYKKRWHIEVDFRNIKTTMGMDILSCTTPEMNEKEIWIYFLAYNLIRLLMAQAALLAEILPRQISFKHSLQLWISWSLRVIDTNCDANVNVLFTLIAQNKVGDRPDRMEPRAVKRRPKALPLLMKPRSEARAEIRKNGHPKRLK